MDIFHIDGGRDSSRVLSSWEEINMAAGVKGGSMAQEWAKTFYRSKQWLRCRNAYIGYRILVDGGLCEECHNKPGFIVHHKISLTSETISNPEIALNHEHLEYVCKDCHDLFDGHGLNKGGRPLCVFDADGQPISVREVDRNGRRY